MQLSLSSRIDYEKYFLIDSSFFEFNNQTINTLLPQKNQNATLVSSDSQSNLKWWMKDFNNQIFLIEYFDGIQKGDLYEEPFQDWYPG